MTNSIENAKEMDRLRAELGATETALQMLLVYLGDILTVADPELSARQRNALVTLLSELDQSRGSRLLELFNVGLKRLSAKASHRIIN